MTDTHRKLDYLRFFYVNEDSLKDKDTLKNQAFGKYKSNVCTLALFPFALQILQIQTVNKPELVLRYKYLRSVKTFALLGAFAACWWEKLQLEKKWRYYDRLYPEAVQLQKDIVVDAQIAREREFLGIKDIVTEEDRKLDPDTQKVYEQFYQLPPRSYIGKEHNPNFTENVDHFGKS
mmetsp:Transcript_17426/g.29321  ORF Transcript_17426/g.29321 Transcript_17426/m.29321 type:complete len:177 (-) Transcript_17426:119-649(-)